MAKTLSDVVISNNYSSGAHFLNDPPKPLTQADHELQMSWLEACARNGSKIPAAAACRMFDGLPTDHPIWTRLGRLLAVPAGDA